MKDKYLIFAIACLFVLTLFAWVSSCNAQTFAIISDYGSADTNESKVSQMVRGWNPEFIITAGDNFHKTLTPLETMIGQYYRWSFPNFFPTAGNHDITDPVNYYLNDATYLTNFTDYFSWLPGNRRYYTITKGDIQFFFFNSDFGGIASYCPGARLVYEPHGVDSNSIQGRWLKAQLALSNAKFKIVVMHNPPFLSFPVDYDTTTIVNCNGTPYRIRMKIDTIFNDLRFNFREMGADMVLSGHTHCGELLEVDGLPYYIQLSGGAPLGSWFANRNPHSKFFYKSDFGATLAKVNGDSINFTLKVVTPFRVIEDNVKRKLQNDTSLIEEENGTKFYSSVDSKLVEENLLMRSYYTDSVFSFSIFPQKSIRIKAKVKAGQDTVTARLRLKEFPHGVVKEVKRVMNGTTIFPIPNMTLNETYFLQVSHRNSISIWTDSVKAGQVIDLTNPANVHAGNIDEAGYMFSGDVNQDRMIDGTDGVLIDNDVQLYKSGYINSDLSGNDYTDIQDLFILESNVTKFVTEIQP
jgi:predicted phosphodiesterase